MPNHQREAFYRWIGLAALAVGFVVLGILANGGEPMPAAADAPKDDAPYDKHAPVDPVAVNGEVFVDWPKPDVLLVLTGEQDGYLEPCGCAGLENQKGGMKRRATFLKQMRDKGWNVLPLDLGGQARRFGIQAERKFDYALRSLIEMGYQAVGLGPADLRLDILNLVINLNEAKNPFVSANIGIVDFDSGFTKRYRIFNIGGMKIGVTSILGKGQFAGLQNSTDVKLVEPYQAIPEVLPKLLAEKCDHLVLLSFADPKETKDLAHRFHEFDIVVMALGGEEPPKEPQTLAGGDTHLIELGQKGEYAIAIGLYKNDPTPFRYQRVPLDSRFKDSPNMQKLMVEYQHELETVGLSGLGVKPSVHPTGRKFAGSKACADCHTAATEVFLNTPHSHATDTLVHLEPPRQFDPECLSCHATGWEPQKYFPFISGYLSLQETPDLVGNGCENCHGPAAQHAAAESGEIAANDAELEKLRAALRLKIVENEGNKEGQEFAKGKVVQMCMQCHDLDNSPEFDFQKYWPKIEHHGKD